MDEGLASPGCNEMCGGSTSRLVMLPNGTTVQQSHPGRYRNLECTDGGEGDLLAYLVTRWAADPRRGLWKAAQVVYRVRHLPRPEIGTPEFEDQP